MGLNVYKFDSFKPFLPHRFACSVNGFALRVKDATIPTFGMDASVGRKRFGTTQFVLPVFQFAESKLEITFYEDDNMSVTSWLISQMQQNGPKPGTISIQLEQLNFEMNKVIWSRNYICDLLEFEAPSFQRASGASAVEIKATFIVRDWNDKSDDDNIDTMTELVAIPKPNKVPKDDRDDDEKEAISAQDQPNDLIGIAIDAAEEYSSVVDAMTKAANDQVNAATAAWDSYQQEVRAKEEDQNAADKAVFAATSADNQKMLDDLRNREQSAAAADGTATTPAPAGTKPNGEYYYDVTKKTKKRMADSNKIAAENGISPLSVEIAKNKLGANATTEQIVAEAKRIDAERAKNGTAYNGMNSAYNKTWSYEYEMGSKLKDDGTVSWGGLRPTATTSSKAQKMIAEGKAEIKDGKLVWTEKGIATMNAQTIAEKHAKAGGQVYDGSDLGGDGKGSGIDCSGLASTVVADTAGTKIASVAGGTGQIIDNAVKTGKYEKHKMDVNTIKQGDIVSTSGSHVVTIAYVEGDTIYAYESTGKAGAQLVAYSKSKFQSKYGKANVASLK